MTDAELLYHHLAFHQAFELRCLKGSPVDFQHLFEAIMARSRTGFMPVRPYGNQGDWKCDGLFRADGTFYQVYSPDRIEAPKLVRKINEDLAGAVDHWGSEMKEWHFVYNVRDGVPPQVVGVLNDLRDKFPGLALADMSNEALWKVASDLSFECLAEILGPPITMLSTKSPSASSRMLIVHDAMMPIDVEKAVEAMAPDEPVGAPVRMWSWDEGEQSWGRAALFQERVIRKLRDEGQVRLAVFSMAPIPLSVHLGYVMSDRIDARLFQYQRDPDRRNWKWSGGGIGAPIITTEGVPIEAVNEPTEVVVRISVSHEVQKDETRLAVGERRAIEIDLAVPEPSVLWLQREEQLKALDHAFREVLQAIDSRVPACRLIHLFYAGPVPGAIRLGQAINPRTTAPVALYQYDKRQTPRHQRVLTLGEGAAANALD